MMIQAGSISLGSTGTLAGVGESQEAKSAFLAQVAFPSPFPQGSNVVVVPTGETFTGDHLPEITITEVTTTGFKVRMDKPASSSRSPYGRSSYDRVGWVALMV